MPVIEVDFTNVESGGGFLAPGVYEAQLVNVEARDGRNYPGLKVTWASVEPETEGQRADMFVSLAPQALWKFKGLLEALGAEVPKSVVRLNTDRLIGKRAVIHVIAEPWTDAEGQQRTSSKVNAVHRRQAAQAKVDLPEIAAPSVLSPDPVSDAPELMDDEDIPF